MIKAVFFDIDGTLVSFRTHRIPDSAVDAVRELRGKGIRVFIATGRHLASVDNLGDLEFDGYVTLNGGLCYAGKEKLIYKRHIPEEDICSMIRFQEECEKFPCICVGEKDMFMNYKNKEVGEVFRLLDFPETPVRELRDALQQNIYQLVAFFREDQENRIMPCLPHCEVTRWNALFTDVVPAGSNKRVGIEKMLEYFGISREETMAFGDGGNDIPMLEFAGTSVAMGNASEAVRRSAGFVTREVDENGVVYALKHFGLL